MYSNFSLQLIYTLLCTNIEYRDIYTILKKKVFWSFGLVIIGWKSVLLGLVVLAHKFWARTYPSSQWFLLLLSYSGPPHGCWTAMINCPIVIYNMVSVALLIPLLINKSWSFSNYFSRYWKLCVRLGSLKSLQGSTLFYNS